MLLRLRFVMLFLPMLSSKAAERNANGACQDDLPDNTSVSFLQLSLQVNSHKDTGRETVAGASHPEGSVAAIELALFDSVARQDHSSRSLYLPESPLEFNDAGSSLDELHWHTHRAGYAEQAPVSFSPDVWNLSPYIKSSHNCYMYALNDLSPRSHDYCKYTIDHNQSGAKRDSQICSSFFHEPGFYFQRVVERHSRIDDRPRNERTCSMMLPLLAVDNPSLLWHNDNNLSLEEDDRCPVSYYMAALYVEPRVDFHFYRRDHVCFDDPNELCWSHKPGAGNATDKDASGARIKLLREADRKYTWNYYSEACGFFCVPENALQRTRSS